MGAVSRLKSIIARPTADEIRAELAAAVCAVAAAKERWVAEESDWLPVEAAKRVVEQLELRLTKAEAIEQAARDEASAAALAAKRAANADTLARIRQAPARVEAIVHEAVEAAAVLARLQEAILCLEDTVAKDTRALRDSCAAIGDPMPTIDLAMPTSAVGVARLVAVSVRQRMSADGVRRVVVERLRELVS